jgi:hypothetical protein
MQLRLPASLCAYACCFWRRSRLNRAFSSTAALIFEAPKRSHLCCILLAAASVGACCSLANLLDHALQRCAN